MGRSPCRSEEGDGLNRGAWTAQEDKLLTSYIETHGEGKWTHVPKRAGLNRSGKSCRLRWLNYLRPDIKRGNITQDEEELIIRLHKLLGNRWSLIAGRLPGRTDNEIKNYWNTTLAKKLVRTQSRASKPEVTRPQVIQTMARKCKNVVIIEPPWPQEKSTVNSPDSNLLEFDEARLSTQFTNQSQDDTPKAPVVGEYHYSDVSLSSPDGNEFYVSEADFCRDFNLQSGMGMVMNAHADQFPPTDELVNCWTTNGFVNNDTMDLDLMSFLLDSRDWP